MTWYPPTQQVAVFGGNGYAQYQNDIWSYSLATSNWTNLAPQTTCPGDTGFTQVNGSDDSNFRYDPVNNLLWVFGAPSGYRCLSTVPIATAGSGTSATAIVDPNIPVAAAGAYIGWQVKSGNYTSLISGYNPATSTVTLATAIPGLAAGSGYQFYATTGAGNWYYDPVAQTWTFLDKPGNAGVSPGTRFSPAVDYSPVAQSMVLWGGAPVGADYSVWQLNLNTKLWAQLPVPSTGTPPAMRELANSFVYDQAHDVFILFGGACSSDPVCPSGTYNGQTWAYKLSTNTWTNMNPGNPPPARAYQVMTYDAANQVVTLFAGTTSNGSVNDTWYYDYPSNTWTQVHPTSSPPVRYLAQAAYNPIAKSTILFGGQNPSGGIYADVWSLTLHPAPTVSISSPASGTSLTAPGSVMLSATASTSGGTTVSQVSYFANGTLIGTSSSAPYSVNWTNVLAGTYAVTAVATDSLGATGTSAPVSVSVGGTYLPPSVTVTGVGGSTSYTAPADIPLSVSATGGSGSIVHVAYYAGSTLLGTATASPWTFDWANVAAGIYSITAVVTDSYGGVTTSPAVQVTVASGITNYALQSNGGVASASSTYSALYPVSSVNDGVRNGRQWGSGGGWNDATYQSYPDWVQISFSGTKTINQINVFTLTDNFANDPDPTSTTTFSLYGITAFNVQYWNGSSWVTVPGGTVTGNNLAWTTFSFPNLSTTAIRVLVNAALAGYSRITEIEAWGPSSGAASNPPSVSLTSPTNGSVYTAPASITLTAAASGVSSPVSKVEFFNGSTSLGVVTAAPYSLNWTNVAAGSYTITAVATDGLGNHAVSGSSTVTVNPATQGSVNVALQSNGGIATASSTYSPAFPASSINDGIRNGQNWGNGGGWNDATGGSYPDWVQVSFNGVQAINLINVYTLTDNFSTDPDPTPTTTFSQYGITAFNVQYWTGSAWATVPGGSITGNNHALTSISFPTINTSAVRVVVNSSLASYSRIVELEAWSPSSVSGPVVTLTSPANGTSYTSPATVNLAASVTDSTGTVNQIEYFNGTTSLGVATSAPYALTWSNVAAGTYSITAVATDSNGAQSTSAASSITVANPVSSNSINVALQSNGGVATASSAYSSNFPASSVNDGVRNGQQWGSSGGWNDATADSYPDWVQVSFNGAQSIDQINVYTLTDNYKTDPDPTATTTFSLYGITAFEVQYWTGTAWADVPGGAITGNNHALTSISFPTLTTSAIRVLVNASLYDYSRIVEIEAWTPP